MTVEDKKCPVFVDGEGVRSSTDPSRSRSQKIARYDLATDQCNLGGSRGSAIPREDAGAAQNSRGWLLSVHSGLRLDPASLCGIWVLSHGENPRLLRGFLHLIGGVLGSFLYAVGGFVHRLTGFFSGFVDFLSHL